MARVRQSTGKAKKTKPRKVRSKKGGANRFWEFKFTTSKKFGPYTPNEAMVWKGLGAFAARMLKARINEQGIDADGKPLPEVSDRNWWFISSGDPRFRSKGGTVPRYVRGHEGSGKPELNVALSGYRDFKDALSGKTRRGQSLTGAAWDNMIISARRTSGGSAARVGVGKGVSVVITFGGSVTTGFVTKDGKRKRVKMRNRDKMALTQFSKRAKGSNYSYGKPAGKADFTLMQLSPDELNKVRDYYIDRLKFWKDNG